jgi:hypothetical protein
MSTLVAKYLVGSRETWLTSEVWARMHVASDATDVALLAGSAGGGHTYDVVIVNGGAMDPESGLDAVAPRAGKVAVNPLGIHAGRGEDDPIWATRPARDRWQSSVSS